MASSSTTRHGASANRRRTPSGGPRRASSARTPTPSTRPSRVRASSSARRRALPAKWVLLVAVVGGLTLTVWSFYPVARVRYLEEREHAKLHAELESLQQRNARLSKQVARLKTPAGVEDEARETLGLVKQGEQPVVVLDSSADKSTSTASKVPTVDVEESVSAPRGPWTPVLDLLFGVHE